jgi:hypothetical protein
VSDELHAVVKLLLQRMESAPEEFKDIFYPADQDTAGKYIADNRWWRALTLVQEYGTIEDKEALATALRTIKLGGAHEWMMDELFNGDERRRKEQEAMASADTAVNTAVNTAMDRLSQSLKQYSQPQQDAYLNQYANQLKQSLGQYSQAQATGIVGKSATLAILDEYANIANTGTITTPTTKPKKR